MQTTMQDLFQKSREQWLEEARHTARKILMGKQTITIEDVLDQCPRPKYLHQNTTGSVFKSPEFKPVGFATSRRTISHGRTVRVWSLKDGYKIPRDRDYEYPETQ